MSDESQVSAVPQTPYKTNQSFRNLSVKPATPDLILFDQDVMPVDAMANLIFEDIGGHEIINMLRYDTVNGKDVNYSLISNTKGVDKSYAPSNIVFAPGSLSEFFKNFAIRLDTHQPETESVNKSDNIYIDKEINIGALVIEVVSMEKNEQVEVQILNSGNYLDGII